MKIVRILWKGKTFAPFIFLIAGIVFICFFVPPFTMGCNNTSAPVTNFTLTFEPIPYDEVDIIAPGRGANNGMIRTALNCLLIRQPGRDWINITGLAGKISKQATGSTTGVYLTRK
jgi:hypothetical protein